MTNLINCSVMFVIGSENSLMKNLVSLMLDVLTVGALAFIKKK